VSKRHSAKYKISRRMGENIWGRAKDPVLRREYAPGQHGAGARRKKLSDYGLQLRAKQKLKGYYGNISEKAFRSIYAEAVRVKGDTSENLVGLLERRLDAVVYRLGIVPTVFASRQFVNHGHVKVNGKRVNIPSYRLKEGDTIEIREKSRNVPMVIGSLKSGERAVPEYLEFDEKAVKGTFVRTPSFSEIPYPVIMEPNLVIEFYSR